MTVQLDKSLAETEMMQNLQVYLKGEKKELCVNF